jgi:hypothetical protein
MPSKVPENRRRETFDLNAKDLFEPIQKELKKTTKQVEGSIGGTWVDAAEEAVDALEDVAKAVSEVGEKTHKADVIIERSFSNILKRIDGVAEGLNDAGSTDLFSRWKQGSTSFKDDLIEISNISRRLDFSRTVNQMGTLTDRIAGARLRLLEPGHPLFDFSASLNQLDQVQEEINRLKFALDNADSDEKKQAASSLIVAQEQILDGMKSNARLTGQWIVALYTAGKPLKEFLDLQHQIQREASHLRVGFEQTSGYIRDMANSLVEVQGILSVGDSLQVFKALSNQSREFVNGTNKVINTVTLLQAGIGMTSDSTARLAYRLKSLGISNYDDKLREIGDQMAWFAKNTDLTTDNIVDLISAADPLVRMFPKELEDKLIPQILAIGSAFKSVGLDAHDFINGLRDISDFSNTSGMFRNMLMQGKGVGFDDLVQSKKLDQGTINLNENLYKMMAGAQGANRIFLSQMLADATGMSREYLMNLSRLSRKELDSMNDKLRLENKMAEAHGAAKKALQEQMEGPISAFKALGATLRSILLQGAASVSFVLKPLQWLADGLNALLSPLAKNAVAAKILGGGLVLFGTILGVVTTHALLKATFALRLFNISLGDLASKSKLLGLGFMETLGSAGGKIGGWVKGLGSSIAEGLSFLSLRLTKFFPTLGSKLFGPIAGLFERIGLKFLGKRAIAAVPVIGLVVAGLWLLWDVLDSLADGSMTQGLVAGLKSAWEGIKNFSKELYVGFLTPLGHLGASLFRLVKMLLKPFWELAKVGFKLVKLVAMPLVWGLKGICKLIGGALHYTLKGLTWGLTKLGDLLEWVSGGIDAFTSMVGRAWTKLGNVVQPAVDGLDYAVTYWANKLGFHTKAVDKNTKALLKDNEMDKFLKEMSGRKSTLALNTTGTDIGRLDSIFKNTERFEGKSDGLNALKRAVFRNSQLKAMSPEQQEKQSKLTGERYDPMLNEKLTSNSGSKALRGESVGEFTFRLVKENKGVTKVVLADGKEIELYNDAQAGAVTSLKSLFVEAKKNLDSSTQWSDEFKKTAFKGINEKGEIDLETLHQSMDANNKTASMMLNEWQTYQLKVVENQLKDLGFDWRNQKAKPVPPPVSLKAPTLKIEEFPTVNLKASQFAVPASETIRVNAPNFRVESPKQILQLPQPIFSIPEPQKHQIGPPQFIIPEPEPIRLKPRFNLLDPTPLEVRPRFKMDVPPGVLRMEPPTVFVAPPKPIELEFPSVQLTPPNPYRSEFVDTAEPVEVTPRLDRDKQVSLIDQFLDKIGEDSNQEPPSDDSEMQRRLELKRLRSEERRTQLAESIHRRSVERSFMPSMFESPEDNIILT